MTVLFICVCVCVSLDVWQGVWHARFAARILNTFNILNLIISDVFVTIFVAISKKKKKKTAILVRNKFYIVNVLFIPWQISSNRSRSKKKNSSFAMICTYNNWK